MNLMRYFVLFRHLLNRLESLGMQNVVARCVLAETTTVPADILTVIFFTSGYLLTIRYSDYGVKNYGPRFHGVLDFLRRRLRGKYIHIVISTLLPLFVLRKYVWINLSSLFFLSPIFTSYYLLFGEYSGYDAGLKSHMSLNGPVWFVEHSFWLWCCFPCVDSLLSRLFSGTTSLFRVTVVYFLVCVFLLTCCTIYIPMNQLQIHLFMINTPTFVMGMSLAQINLHFPMCSIRGWHVLLLGLLLLAWWVTDVYGKCTLGCMTQQFGTWYFAPDCGFVVPIFDYNIYRMLLPLSFFVRYFGCKDLNQENTRLEFLNVGSTIAFEMFIYQYDVVFPFAELWRYIYGNNSELWGFSFFAVASVIAVATIMHKLSVDKLLHKSQETKYAVIEEEIDKDMEVDKFVEMLEADADYEV